jgi:hypothetical protein
LVGCAAVLNAHVSLGLSLSLRPQTAEATPAHEM